MTHHIEHSLTNWLDKCQQALSVLFRIFTLEGAKWQNNIAKAKLVE